MSAELTDRNLLFGVLALQADLLDARKFAEACSAWAACKDTPLADLLVERGWLTAADRAHLDYLLERKLHKHGGDARASLRHAATVPDVRGMLESVADPDVRQSLAELSTPPGTSPARTVAYEPGGRARYTLTRLHAQGGIGRVWLARDEDLGRDVALKELRPDRGDSPTAAARFLEEARVTGQLEHPGIVPVYELVQPPDGRPCYAMRFVGGRTLADAIKDYHRREAGEAGPLALRELLGAFVGVCNAVAYAHSRGVLHRDLKPQNVALGDYGEVLVLDWGLAKVLGTAEEPTGLLPVAPGGGDGAGWTQQGQVLGTPAYMSPEQAAGRPDLVDRRSDVYGLGAILYEVLTGTPPFAGADTPEVLKRVVQEPVVPPRQRVPATPAALEAVCLKVLAKQPAARYASARELAQEVQRWLADEPVAAYREPLGQRLGRWGRRHRTAVASAAALLVTAVAALAVGLVLVNAERARTAQANAALAAEKEKTQDAYQAEARRRRQAREALDAMSSQVIDDWLAKQKQPTEAQKRFLEQALASYEEFARDTGQDEPARVGVAAAYLRAGSICLRLGQWKEAEAAYRASQERYARLAADFPAVPDHRQGLAQAHNNLGNLFVDTGRTREAEAEYRAALDLRQGLADDFPAVPAYRQELATSHSNLAGLLATTGRPQDAEGEYRQALALCQHLADESPNLPDSRWRLAHTHVFLGTLLQNTGRSREAEGEYRTALALYQRLADDFPTAPGYRQELALGHNNLGTLLYSARRGKEAAAEYRAALALQQRLADDFPAAPGYRQDLAKSHTNLGLLLMDTGHIPEAEAEYRQALALYRRLADEFPTVPAYRYDQAKNDGNLGVLFMMTARPREAEGELRKALDLFRRLADDFPTVPNYQNEAAGTLLNLALLAGDRHDWAGARRLLEEGLPHHQAALKANPRHPVYRRYFRGYTLALADTLLHLGDHAGAAAAADRLAELAVEPANDLYQAAGFLARAVPLAAKDEKLSAAKRKELAKDYADRALAVLRQAVQKGYKDVARLKKDPDLDSLRQRDDFRRLLAELEKKKPEPR
jgi:serine/threonine protein kinase/Flp pilus assembly protein TadD